MADSEYVATLKRFHFVRDEETPPNLRARKTYMAIDGGTTAEDMTYAWDDEGYRWVLTGKCVDLSPYGFT